MPKRKPLKPPSQSTPVRAVADAPTDTGRLDKLERIEKQIRGAHWFFSRDGIIVAAKKQEKREPATDLLRIVA